MSEALVYRRGGLGDTLLLFPLLEVLKRKGYRVTAVGNADYLALAKEAGFADRVLSYLPKEPFKLKLLFTKGHLPPLPTGRVWAVEHYLKAAGFKNEPFSLTLPIKGSGELAGAAVLHPGSGSKKKRAPLKLFLELAEELTKRGLKVRFILGEAEEELREELKDAFFSSSALKTAKALKGAALFVGNDSGLTHLAAYLGVPTVALFGPTDPLVWRPIGKKVRVVTLNLPCSPCFPNVCETRSCLTDGKIKETALRAVDNLIE
ncbi:MAG: glycosyltransferase family 9 protein [Aquificae bacterium]|nr:glycosyltransferase family 9 protein [Aquificota bacterium]